MKTRCKPSAKHVVISSDWLGKRALHGIPKLKFFPRLTHIIYIWMHWLILYDQAIPLKHIQIKSSGVCILQPKQRCIFFNWMWLKSNQYLAPLLCFKFTVNYFYWKYSPIPLILKQLFLKSQNISGICVSQIHVTENKPPLYHTKVQTKQRPNQTKPKEKPGGEGGGSSPKHSNLDL